jgi:hypothetical protein
VPDLATGRARNSSPVVRFPCYMIPQTTPAWELTFTNKR